MGAGVCVRARVCVRVYVIGGGCRGWGGHERARGTAYSIWILISGELNMLIFSTFRSRGLLLSKSSQYAYGTHTIRSHTELEGLVLRIGRLFDALNCKLIRNPMRIDEKQHKINGFAPQRRH